MRELSAFLCHSSGDKSAVRELHRRLKLIGVKPWLDEEDLLPGQDWQREIPIAVKAADVVLVCLSQSAVTKEGYVQKEIQFALDVAGEKPEGAIFLVPVRLENCDVPGRLQRWQYVDLFQPQGYERLGRTLDARRVALGIPVSSQKNDVPGKSQTVDLAGVHPSPPQERGSIRDRFVRIVVEQLGVDENEVTLDARFVDDLGIDSLDVVELVVTVEAEFGIEIADDDAEHIETVRNAINYISMRASQ